MDTPRSHLAGYLESLPEPHILCDASYRIVAANAAYRQRFGQAPSVVGRCCYEASHHYDRPCDQAGESCPMALARQSGQRERVLHLHHTPQGQSYVSIELTPLFDASGQLDGFIEKMDLLPHVHQEPREQGLVGRSPAFRRMLAQVSRVAPSQASVMLLGETGTGKELVARTLHEASARAARPFVPVDCSSLTETLFESELFGHERGAFTDAHRSRTGLVESAHEGTLFLDEVGDIPLSMQVKLLRLLESGTYRRVGSTEQRQADLRIVSATHRDLRAMVRDGRFREDLFHRLNTFPVRVPALRERPEDLPLLAQALLRRASPDRALKLATPALQRLARHDYPGNVRELRNLIERVVLLTDGDTVQLSHVEQALDMDQDAGGPAAPEVRPILAAAPAAGTRPIGSARAARRLQLEALRAVHAGTRAELAQAVGVSERTLYRMLRERPPA